MQGDKKKSDSFSKVTSWTHFSKQQKALPARQTLNRVQGYSEVILDNGQA